MSYLPGFHKSSWCVFRVLVFLLTMAAVSWANGSLPTVNLGSINIGSSSPAETFTVANLGTSDRSGLVLALDGPHASDFVVASATPDSLSPGGSGTFTIRFQPTAAGLRTAILRVVSDVPDENLFSIHLSGIGIPAPEIAVLRSDATEHTAGQGVHDFGNVNLAAGQVSEIFTIHNPGSANLTGLAISITGTHGSDFTFSPLSTAFLAPGTSTSVQVSFQPGAAGIRTATLRIASNDADENPFNIALTGQGVAVPILSLENPAGAPFDPASAALAFGNVSVGSSGPVETVILKNNGTGILTGIQVSVGGAESSDFVLAAPSPTHLDPGASASFTIAFNPTGSGPRSAVIQVTSNLSPLAPFAIALSGNGTAVPQIEILQKSKKLKSKTAFINFGVSKSRNQGRTRVLTIRNSGTGLLTGISIKLIGRHRTDFKVAKLRVKSLAPGASAKFRVTFKPTRNGSRWAGITIRSNDDDQRAFKLVLTGRGKKLSTTSK